MVLSLVDMKPGENGVVVNLEGGHGFITRIQSIAVVNAMDIIGVRNGRNTHTKGGMLGRSKQKKIIVYRKWAKKIHRGKGG